MSRQVEDTEIKTPKAALREKMAKDAQEREKNTKVIKEWVELVKRTPQEDGKVILKRLTNNGYEHSWYVGRESRCKEWLLEQEKAGLYKPHKVRG